jgi:hypothetical protein
MIFSASLARGYAGPSPSSSPAPPPPAPEWIRATTDSEDLRERVVEAIARARLTDCVAESAPDLALSKSKTADWKWFVGSKIWGQGVFRHGTGQPAVRFAVGDDSDQRDEMTVWLTPEGPEQKVASIVARRVERHVEKSTTGSIDIFKSTDYVVEAELHRLECHARLDP